MGFQGENDVMGSELRTCCNPTTETVKCPSRSLSTAFPALVIFLLLLTARKVGAQPVGWSEAFLVSSASGEGLCPALARVESGTLCVFWSGPREGYYALFSRVAQEGGENWFSENALFGGVFDALFPAAATIGDTVYLAWVRSPSPRLGQVMHARSLDGGATWGPAQGISSIQPRTTSVSIAGLGSMIHLAWADARSGTPNVFYAVSMDAGDTWSVPRPITSRETYCWYPSIAARGTGVYLVWEDWRNGAPEVYFAKSTDQGENWGSATPISLVDRFSSERPVIVATETRLHVSWQDESAGGYAVKHAYSSNAGSSWFGRRLTAPDADARQPAITAGVDAVSILFQSGMVGGQELFRVESSDQGQNWLLPTPFTPVDGHWSGLATIVIDNVGESIAWTDLQSGTPEIRISFQLPPSAVWGGWNAY